jgi:hypothetical protein
VVQEKMRLRNIKKYGHANFSKTIEFSTQMKAYHKNLSDDEKQKIQFKREQTNLTKYGNITPLANAEVQAKITRSLLLNYGVSSPLCHDEIKERAKRSSTARYGRDHFAQQHLSTETIENIQNKNWLETQLMEYSTKQIAKNCNISYSVLCKYIKRAGIVLTANSYFEHEVKTFVETILPRDVDVIMNNRNVLSGKEIDIYIPSLNIGIECNGVYWHREGKGKHRKYHISKTLQAEKLGVRLIHIFENEWADKRKIVENRLHVLLGNVCRVFGRKCKITMVSSAQEKQFLTECHLQGSVRSKICYGLLYDDQLVAIMSFGKSRYNKKVEWELLRYAAKDNIIVLGGAEKLFNKFVGEQNPNSVISYCDRRWFTGKMYSVLGFSFLHNSNPNYFYLEPSGTLSSRVKYQKHKLKNILAKFDHNLSEWDNMQENGYDRVWDCGNSVWLWDK